MRQRDSARIVLCCTGRFRIDHAHSVAALMQGQRGGEADRAGTGDQDRLAAHGIFML